MIKKGVFFILIDNYYHLGIDILKRIWYTVDSERDHNIKTYVIKEITT